MMEIFSEDWDKQEQPESLQTKTKDLKQKRRHMEAEWSKPERTPSKLHGSVLIHRYRSLPIHMNMEHNQC